MNAKTCDIIRDRPVRVPVSCKYSVFPDRRAGEAQALVSHPARPSSVAAVARPTQQR